MLYLIGIGLFDEKDITIRGLEIIRESDFVYLDNYTSKLNLPLEKLERFFKKKIILADRSMIELDSDNQILKNAKKRKVSFLVIGDVFSATTHMDIFLRAHKQKIETFVINNASILTAIGITGLQLYNFGKTTSIPLNKKNIESPYYVLNQNFKNNLHTLFLLDIIPDEKRFMNVNEAIQYLLDIEKKKKLKIFNEETMSVACAQLGAPNHIIKYGKAKDILKLKINGVQSLIVPAKKLHFMEEEVLSLYKV